MYQTQYHDDLKGMETLGVLFASDLSQDREAYNGWNFSTPSLFDEFWFDAQDNSILYRSERFRIGK